MSRQPSFGSEILSAGLEALTHNPVNFGCTGVSVSNVHSWLLAPGPVAAASEFKTEAVILPHEKTCQCGADVRVKDGVSHEDEVPKSASEESPFVIYVKCLTGKTFRVRVSPTSTVQDLMQAIKNADGVPCDHQRLIVSGRGVRAMGSEKIGDTGMYAGCTVHLVLQMVGGGGLQVDRRSLAPEYNFDFTKAVDDGSLFVRGGEEYCRPYGWMRYALAVVGKYGNDCWLGLDGIRNHSTSGEWPVSYHGTDRDGARSISETGYQLSKGKRFAFGRAIYTTPDVEVAARYAREFTVDGRKYQVVLQNRINPKTLHKIPRRETTCGEYWLNENEGDVRPYGILIREAPNKRRRVATQP